MDEHEESEDEFDEEDSEDENEGNDENEDSEKLNIFAAPKLDEVINSPDKILKTKEMQDSFAAHQGVKNYFKDDSETKPKVHPGFIATYSFGEQEYDRLHKLLLRLDEVAERVMTFRQENLSYLPEFFGTLKNFFICINFIVDSTNRTKIEKGFDYVQEAVIKYTTSKEMNTTAITILGEIYLLLSNIKNFHGLGFSYEKKRGDSEKYAEAFFKKRKAR